MRNYAEELRAMAVANNTPKGQGYTRKSNLQSGFTRVLNSGADFMNKYVDMIEQNAYNEGLNQSKRKLDLKSAIFGGSIVSGAALLVGAYKKIENYTPKAFTLLYPEADEEPHAGNQTT